MDAGTSSGNSIGAARYSCILILILIGTEIAEGQDQIIDLREIAGVVDIWTDAHNEKNLIALEELYDAELIYYTKKLPRERCLTLKGERLQARKFFFQQIITEPEVKVYDTEIIKVSFKRQVISGTDVTDYDAYLLLKRVESKLKIVGESHVVDDRKAKLVLDIGKELEIVKISENRLKVVHQANASQEVAIDEIPKSSEDSGGLSWLQGVIVLGIVVLFWSIRKGRSFWKAFSLMKRSQEKGLAFEKFVVNRFDRKYYKLLDWTSDKIIDGVYAQSTFNPDLHYQFRYRNHVKEFAVECKYRSRLIDGMFELEERQLENYRRYGRDKGIPVFIALGIGGRPSAPKALFMIPLSLFMGNTAVGYESLRFYYNSPKHNFFLNPEVAEGLWFRKSKE